MSEANKRARIEYLQSLVVQQREALNRAAPVRQEELMKILSTIPIRDLTNPGGELDQLRLREAVRVVDELIQRAFDLGFNAAGGEIYLSLLPTMDHGPPFKGWCSRCGCGNDYLGFGHMRGCENG